MPAAYQEVISLVAHDDTRAGVARVEGALNRLKSIATFPIRVLDQATAPLRGIFNLLQQIGLAAMGLHAVANGVQSLVKPAGDLQQAVANIGTIKPEVDSTALFASLNEMQRRVPQSAAQLGDALYNIFSSIDVSVEDGTALLEKFSKGAVGAQTDAETFGTAILGVMNAYKLSVSDADHISDVFFNTVNRGVVNGQELANGIGLVTQSAKLAGVSLDEMGALIVGVTKEGGPAAQNLNNLNNLLLKITDVNAQQHMADIGVATKDANGHFRSQIDVLTDLNTRLSKMTEVGRNAALQKIFPDLQARAGATVIMGELDSVRQALDENKNAGGSAARAYEIMAATFNSQSKILGNTVTSIFTEMGAMILPHITPVLTFIAQKLPDAMKILGAVFTAFTYDAGAMGLALDFVGTVFGEDAKTAIQPYFQLIMDLIPVVQRFINDALAQLPRVLDMAGEAWAYVNAQIEIALGYWNTITTFIQNNVGAQAALVGVLAAIATGFVVLNILVPIFTGVMGILNIVLAANPIFLIVLAIVGLAAAFIYAYNTSGEFKDAVDGALSWIAENVLPKFQAALQYVIDNVWPKLVAAFQFLTDTVLPELGRLFNWIVDTVLPPVVAAFAAMGDIALKKLQDAFQWLTDVGLPALGKGFDWLRTTVLPPIQAAFDAVWGAIKPIIEAARNMPSLPSLPSGGIGPATLGTAQGASGTTYTIPNPLAGTEARAGGGWIDEPVVGMGLRSRRAYTLAERGPEYVSPAGRGGAHVELHVHEGAVQVSGANGPAQGWADAAESLWADLNARLRMSLEGQGA